MRRLWCLIFSIETFFVIIPCYHHHHHHHHHRHLIFYSVFYHFWFLLMWLSLWEEVFLGLRDTRILFQECGGVQCSVKRNLMALSIVWIGEQRRTFWKAQKSSFWSQFSLYHCVLNSLRAYERHVLLYNDKPGGEKLPVWLQIVRFTKVSLIFIIFCFLESLKISYHFLTGQGFKGL